MAKNLFHILEFAVLGVLWLMLSFGFARGAGETLPRVSYSALELGTPAGNRPTEIIANGATVIPNGRLITPLGVAVKVAPHPYGLALSRNGKILVTSNDGVQPFSISIIRRLDSSSPSVTQIPPGFNPPHPNLDSTFLGVAFSPHDRTVYVSEGNNGEVGAFDLRNSTHLWTIDLDQPFGMTSYHRSLTGELKLSPDGRWLYVLDLAHFRLVVIATRHPRILASVPVGRLPFGLAISPDGRRVYVSNVGMFRYHLLPGYRRHHPNSTGLDFPPFGFPSPEALNGTTVNGRKIPGLGNPNNPASNSLWVLNAANPRSPRVEAKIETGWPVGPESVGGSSPGAVVAGRDKVFVSNANQDSITILNARTDRIEKTLVLSPAPILHGLEGVIPFGMALSPDEKRLYVACGGINALAVIDTANDRVLGYIPTAWFPARVRVSPNGKMLYVENAKGFGAGPNGGPNFHQGPEGAYIGIITKGVVSIFPVPSDAQLPRLTREVLSNNGFNLPPHPVQMGSLDSPIPPPGHASRDIRYVVFIIKENRTFDEVFGDLGAVHGDTVNGDAALARWGMDATVTGKNEPTIYHAFVTPNEHALARRFAVSDNYYVDSDVSFDGHSWLQGDYPDEVVETAWPATYGGKLKFEPDNSAPGRLELGGSSSPRPEGYLERGSIWDHFARHQILFRNYGEDVSEAGNFYGAGLEPTGTRPAVNMPMPEAVFLHTSRTYPTFDTSIPDQYRFRQFQKEFRSRYLSGKHPFPQFMYIWLPNDHTARPRPADGYPYRASYVADNDLALGKMVELLSHSPFWKHMAIFITEDDAQDGRDHVDAHRSLLLVVSPYARPGVSHVHTSMNSILKTFDLIFGLPPLNQYDAAATDLSDMFTSQPDFTPYTALPSDNRIFDPTKARDPKYYARRGEPLPPSAPLDDPARIYAHFAEQ